MKTPRTDAEATMAYLRGDSQMTEVVPANICRGIERELIRDAATTLELWNQHDPNDGVVALAETLFLRARSLERDLATLKAERDEAREKLRKALATLRRIGSNQSRYYGSEAMNMFNELTK